MIVVSNTSPLNYLIPLGHIEVVPEFYGRVSVPSAVLRELQHTKAPEAVRIWAAVPPPWIHLVQVPYPDDSLPEELGRGEREAISLAVLQHAGVLLIDERAGRMQAELRSVPVVGTLAVLLQAAVLRRLSFPA